MNSLVNYGSDDDYDDSSEEKQTDWRGSSSREKQSTSHRQNDANYEEVQMDLSEESNDSRSEAKEAASRKSRDRDSRDRKDHRHDSRDDHRSRRNSRDKDGRGRNEKEDRYGNNHRRDRDRKPKRSSSRERRRSRSPRRSDRDAKHSRSRSRSRDRSGRKYTKRSDRAGSRSRQVESGRNVSVVAESQKAESEEKRGNTSENDRFFMPGITGRFRDQIERRKQLWQKKDVDQDNKNGQNKKVWETTTFAQDTDGKVANKFKRLMGIKGNPESGGSGTDGLKKQEEMFSSMEQQYEVARTATHTMRGVGLGFGSYQR